MKILLKNLLGVSILNLLGGISIKNLIEYNLDVF